MSLITKILDKSIEISLLLILLIFPFSYSQVSIKYLFVFIVLIGTIGIFLLKNMTNITKTGYWSIFIAIIFMFVYDLSEKVNFIQQFNIPIEINKSIPLATIFLSVAFLAYLVKIYMEGKFVLPGQPFVRYFIVTGAFLCLLLLVFYLVIKAYYQINFKTSLVLVNRFFKYVCILLLITNYLNNEKMVKKLNFGLLVSFVVSTITIFIMKGLNGS